VNRIEDVVFSPVVEEDLDACAVLFVEAFKGKPWNESWTHARARRRLQETLHTPGAFAVAARLDGVEAFAAGFGEQGYDGRVFYLKEMAVRPNWQRCGLGRLLAETLEREIRRLGYGHMYLLTRRGTPALNFYVGAGFHISQRTLLLSKPLE
jgi:aminoglycoside 6'-N-acetyltransferase I